MHNILLILNREYWTRVKSKTFLLTTFLAPIGMVLMIAVLVFLMSRGSDETKTIAVIDNSQVVDQSVSQKGNLLFVYNYNTLDKALKAYKSEELDGVLELPAVVMQSDNFAMSYHADKALALDEIQNIKSAFRKSISAHKIQSFGIDPDQLDYINPSMVVNPISVLNTEKEMSSITSAVSSILGGIVGYGLVFIIMIYGSQVMRSVTEEKINRIVEVLISTVKPFELMMGKVLGVGLVGLTQIMIWLILITIFSFVGMAFLPTPDVSQAMTAVDEIDPSMMVDISNKITPVIKELVAINWLKIIPLYLFYFIAGYFTYAALFAAIGSAVGDDIQEAQSLTMISTLPLMASLYIGVSAIQAPDSTLAVWSSILPFSAPVVMPVRLASDPPTWQIMASILISILTVIGLVFLAAKIYRVGILMYGKKASFKELIKWMRY